MTSSPLLLNKLPIPWHWLHRLRVRHQRASVSSIATDHSNSIGVYNIEYSRLFLLLFYIRIRIVNTVFVIVLVFIFILIFKYILVAGNSYSNSACFRFALCAIRGVCAVFGLRVVSFCLVRRPLLVLIWICEWRRNQKLLSIFQARWSSILAWSD